MHGDAGAEGTAACYTITDPGPSQQRVTEPAISGFAQAFAISQIAGTRRFAERFE